MAYLQISRTFEKQFPTSESKILNNFQFSNNAGKHSMLTHSIWLKKKALFSEIVKLYI